jgi:hypothetical protein
MRTEVVGSSNLCDTSVCCHDDNWRLIAFKCSVQEGETFNIKHVDLIDEEYTRNNFSSSFFSPFSNLLINLFSNFWFDFTDITCKKSKETLSSAINNINFM